MNLSENHTNNSCTVMRPIPTVFGNKNDPRVLTRTGLNHASNNRCTGSSLFPRLTNRAEFFLLDSSLQKSDSLENFSSQR